MTEAEAVEAICARWVAAWASLQPTVPYALPNEALPTAGLATFVNVTFGAIASKQISQGAIGSRMFERRGVVNVKLFGAVDAGEAPLATLMGSVRDALESREVGAGDLGSVQTFAVSTPTPPTRAQGWYTKTAAVPFRFFERR